MGLVKVGVVHVQFGVCVVHKTGGCWCVLSLQFQPQTSRQCWVCVAWQLKWCREKVEGANPEQTHAVLCVLGSGYTCDMVSHVAHMAPCIRLSSRAFTTTLAALTQQLMYPG
jgi:hypothetical protein